MDQKQEYIISIISFLILICFSAGCISTPKERGLKDANISKQDTVSLYELTHGAVGPILYLFAHQDDELLAMNKLILDVKAGTDVHVVWITDGGKSANPARRQQESRKVMKLVGVPEQNLHFLGFPDQESHHYLREAYKQVVALQQDNTFAQVVSPAYEGGNIDHDVAAFLAAQLAGLSPSHPIHIDYPLYNRYHGYRRVGIFLPGHESEAHYLTMDNETRNVVKTAIKEYRSERIPLWLMFLVADKQAFLDHGAPYRLSPAYDFRQRPSDEPCDYEKSFFHHASFQEWQKSVTDFLKMLPQDVGEMKSRTSPSSALVGTVIGKKIK